jgi:hypothetical protein
MTFTQGKNFCFIPCRVDDSLQTLVKYVKTGGLLLAQGPTHFGSYAAIPYISKRGSFQDLIHALVFFICSLSKNEDILGSMQPVRYIYIYIVFSFFSFV